MNNLRKCSETYISQETARKKCPWKSVKNKTKENKTKTKLTKTI